MLTYFAAAEESAEGIGALGISLTSLVIQLVTFVLVYLVLRRFAFGPIVKVLKERRDVIDSGVTLGEQMKVEKAQFEKTVAEQLKEARKQADTIVADAQATAKDTVHRAEETAQAKAAIIIKEGKERGEQEVVRARKQLESELVSLISEATETIIGEKVDAKKDQALVDQALRGAKA